MLAGYLRDIEESAGWGIPYLRDIPWIGWLFGGASTRKETVQRMFVLTPHIVDLDREMLARLQATRLRDVTGPEQMQDDADESDDERERRDLERKDNRERRREKAEDHLERRKAEIDHGREMRQIDRRRAKNRLEADVRAWKEQARAEKARLEAEERLEAEREKTEKEKAEQAKDAMDCWRAWRK